MQIKSLKNTRGKKRGVRILFFRTAKMNKKQNLESTKPIINPDGIGLLLAQNDRFIYNNAGISINACIL